MRCAGRNILIVALIVWLRLVGLGMIVIESDDVTLDDGDVRLPVVMTTCLAVGIMWEGVLKDEAVLVK